MNELGEEPQSLLWAHTQTVIHPIVNYYKCPIDGETITHEHIMITDDMKHDKYAVKAFEDASMNSLKSLGFKPKCILQFCDNCSGQYESKGPFEYTSLSGAPVIRSFFLVRMMEKDPQMGQQVEENKLLEGINNAEI